MEYNYPNSAFSVILNVKNNQYANTSLNYSDILKERAGVEDLNRAIEIAKDRVSVVLEAQKEAYRELNQLLQSNGAKISLQQMLLNSTGVLDEKNYAKGKNKEERKQILKQAQRDLISANNEFRRQFQTIIKAAAGIITQEQANQCIDEANKAMDQMYRAFEQARKDQQDIENRLSRLSSKADPNSLLSSVIFSPNNSSGGFMLQLPKNINKDQRKRIEQAFSAYDEITTASIKQMKGSRRYYRQRRRTDDAFRKIEENLATAFADFFGEANTNIIMKSLFESYRSGQAVTPEKINRSLNLAQETGYIFESVANISLQNIIKQSIDENTNILINGGSVTEKTRILLRLKTNISKKDIKELEEDLEAAENAIAKEFEEILAAFKALDKIDDYITIKAPNSDASYTLAFSDKLYKNISDISILTGLRNTEGAISGASTLLNSLDLISNIGADADAFIFAALNASSASVFYNKRSQKTLTAQLKQLLTSFIYEVAYNPSSFVSQVLKQIGMEDSKVIYFHRIGPQPVPSFIILENVLATLNNWKKFVDEDKMVKVNIAFDNKSKAKSFIETLNSNPQYTEDNKYTTAAWNYVASQVANNTLINVHLNLLPGALNLSKDWLL